MQPPRDFDEYSLLVKSDFRNYLDLAFAHRRHPRPTRLQYLLGLFIVDPTIDRKVAECYRGIGKSTIAHDAICWLALRDPELRFLIIGADDDAALKLSTWIWTTIRDGPTYDGDPLPQLLLPLQPGLGQRKAKNEFFFSGATSKHRDASVVSSGIKGGYTGSRPHHIFIDDPETPQNCQSVKQRQNLEIYSKEIEFLPNKDELQSVTYLTTGHAGPDSLCDKVRPRGYKTLVIPQRYPTADFAEYLGKRLCPELRADIDRDPSLMTGGGLEGTLGKPADPERFNEEACRREEVHATTFYYVQQYCMDRRMQGKNRYPFRCEQLIVADVDREYGFEFLAYGREKQLDLECVGFDGDGYFAPIGYGPPIRFTGKVMTVDPAGGGGDEIAYSIVSFVNGFVYWLRCNGLKGGYTPENAAKICADIVAYQVPLVLVEPNMGEGSWTKMLAADVIKFCESRNWNCAVQDDERSVTNKNLKIISILGPVVQHNRLVVAKKLIQEDFEDTYPNLPPEEARDYRALFQFTHITTEKGCLLVDDRVETLAAGVRHFLPRMGIHPTTQIGQSRRADVPHFGKNSYTFGGSKAKVARKPRMQDWVKTLRGRERHDPDA